MDLRKTFGTDPDIESAGIDVHLGGDLYLTLARAGGGNLRYEASMRKHFAPHKRALSAGTLDEKTATEVLKKVYSEAVIIGWRGTLQIDGDTLPYSPANALRAITEFPELWRIVQEESGKFTNFRAAEVQEMGEVSPG